MIDKCVCVVAVGLTWYCLAVGVIHGTEDYLTAVAVAGARKALTVFALIAGGAGIVAPIAVAMTFSDAWLGARSLRAERQLILTQISDVTAFLRSDSDDK